jgi:hypothetical protein
METRVETEQQLQKNKNDIAKLLDFFCLELQKKNENPTFATVGDLQKIKTDLMETLSFMSGFSKELIESSLEE